jgi:lipoyl(octanoyl) transferase
VEVLRPELWVCNLGRVPYLEGVALQERLRAARQADELSDVLLMLEHPPVYTRGRRTEPGDLPMGEDWYRMQGIDVCDSDRGGRVTYHGPGQLVGYPILDLHGHRPDLHWYLRRLEDVLIRALAHLDIEADRNPGLTGVWTSGRKIASIGIHVKQWVTLHGFALNVTTDLDPFDLIVPCGIRQVVMTSVASELLREDSDGLMAETRGLVVEAFCEVFGMSVVMAGSRVP